jgi:hypothetical protein
MGTTRAQHGSRLAHRRHASKPHTDRNDSAVNLLRNMAAIRGRPL